MTDPLSPSSPTDSDPNPQTSPHSDPASAPKDSYVKLAMRNMVRKSGTSLTHFALTTVGLLALLIGLAYLTR
jgi:hypothetical protein